MPSTSRGDTGVTVRALHDRAKALEKLGRWYEACALYDRILIKDRNQSEVREAFRRCLRQFRQERRLKNGVLQQQMYELSPVEALQLYEEVLSIITTAYVDRTKVKLKELFREGLKELESALQTSFFTRKYLKGVPEDRLHAFRAQLREWMGLNVRDRFEARERISQLVLRAVDVHLRPGVVVLELACGACHSLDEYSFYLSPSRLIHSQTVIKQKHAGIGVELSVDNQKLTISRVYRKSTAEEMGLQKGDRLVRINGRWLDPLDPETAMEKLQGEIGSSVDLEVIPRGQKAPQVVKVSRQAVLPSSVDFERHGENGRYLGYIRIFDFQHSTVQEVKDALAQLQLMPLDGVVLDLRSNPGGLFKSGLGVAELFLGEGVITHTVSQLPGWSRTYRVHNPTASDLTLVVLIDNGTASAAEIVAGALKDNERATLLGQTTFGKGSIQCTIPLERSPGGLRLTIAKFTSPNRQTLHGQGVTPHVVINGNEDEVLKAAFQFLLTEMP